MPRRRNAARADQSGQELRERAVDDPRIAYFREIGCVEVPIPPEWITQELSYAQCRGPIGYLVSMQYLEQNKTLARTPALGQWACIPGGTPFVGVASQ